MKASSRDPEHKPEDSSITGRTVATPEGDNEFAPDQPLKPIDEGHQRSPAIDTNKL